MSTRGSDNKDQGIQKDLRGQIPPTDKERAQQATDCDPDERNRASEGADKER
jgi:hypothetical protein